MLRKLLGKAMGIRFIGMAIHGLALRYGISVAGGMTDSRIVS
jgi:hypothetical protein